MTGVHLALPVFLHGEKFPSETAAFDTRKLENIFAHAKREFSAKRIRKIVFKILVIKRNVA
jgi:hypothetical protein